MNSIMKWFTFYPSHRTTGTREHRMTNTLRTAMKRWTMCDVGYCSQSISRTKHEVYIKQMFNLLRRHKINRMTRHVTGLYFPLVHIHGIPLTTSHYHFQLKPIDSKNDLRTNIFHPFYHCLHHSPFL